MQNVHHLQEEGLCKSHLILFSLREGGKKKKSSSNFSYPLGVGVDNSPPPCSPKKFGTCNQTTLLMIENQSLVEL